MPHKSIVSYQLLFWSVRLKCRAIMRSANAKWMDVVQFSKRFVSLANNNNNTHHQRNEQRRFVQTIGRHIFSMFFLSRNCFLLQTISRVVSRKMSVNYSQSNTKNTDNCALFGQPHLYLYAHYTTTLSLLVFIYCLLLCWSHFFRLHYNYNFFSKVIIFYLCKYYSAVRRQLASTCTFTQMFFILFQRQRNPLVVIHPLLSRTRNQIVRTAVSINKLLLSNNLTRAENLINVVNTRSFILLKVLKLVL